MKLTTPLSLLLFLLGCTYRDMGASNVKNGIAGVRKRLAVV
jgi:hypothetical protein